MKKYQQISSSLYDLLNQSFYDLNENIIAEGEIEEEEEKKEERLVHEDRFEILSNFNFKTKIIETKQQEILQSTFLDSFMFFSFNLTPQVLLKRISNL
jgi:hypothetical protein